MTIDARAAVVALQASWSTVDVDDLRALTGGQWASLAHLRLSGAPDDVPSDVVLRVMPDPEMGAKELAVQMAAAGAGIRTPRVHLSGVAGGPLVDAWSVMDLAPGAPLLAGLDGPAALRQLPALVRNLPRQLADTMAAIHRVDPSPVLERARIAAPSVTLSVDQLMAHLDAAATELGAGALADALERLRAEQPDERDVVLCHGDLHPFNILADANQLTVLDWTAAIVAPPAYDVALTWLLVRHPPIVTPPFLRPAISAGAAVVARRFVRSYRRANPSADLRRLDWYAGLHATRILVDLTTWRRAGDPRADTHPWRLVAPGAARVLRRATGVRQLLD